jgi:hypothetical protein
MPRSQADKDFVLDRAVPHRLQALYALTIAVDLIAKKNPDDAGGFSLEVNGNVAVQGSAAGITNAWLEVGIVHGRALLECRAGCKVPKREPGAFAHGNAVLVLDDVGTGTGFDVAITEHDAAPLAGCILRSPDVILFEEHRALESSRNFIGLGSRLSL